MMCGVRHFDLQLIIGMMCGVRHFDLQLIIEVVEVELGKKLTT
jgi:hypothetical protein